MACPSCRNQVRSLARSLRIAELPSSRSPFTTIASRQRQFSSAAWRHAPEARSGGPSSDLIAHANESLAGRVEKNTSRPRKEYFVIKRMEDLYAACAAPAKYTIAEELRNNDMVEKTAEGEEIGTGEGPWLQVLDLLPTFSAWSQVTMLHMYLIVARLRCFPRDRARNLQHQFVDNYFFDCERVMHVNHGITSAAMRQRYLKDIFVQWRGLIAAYDEGVVKGDAVLASAVWRNLFKAREDVDFRQLAMIVAWMRKTLQDLETMDEPFFVNGSRPIFKRDLGKMYPLVDTLVPTLRKEFSVEEEKTE